LEAGLIKDTKNVVVGIQLSAICYLLSAISIQLSWSANRALLI